jgi:folate-dependent phosphoribosylglycinamide formyltransferase PurN
MLVNLLRQQYPDLAVGLEQPEPPGLMLKRRAKRIGAWKVFGQVLFMVAVRWLCRSGRARNEQLRTLAGLDPVVPAGLPVRRFASANSSECIAWLGAERPDVVVVNGTRILSAALLSACEAVFLNIHCGITPAYRGVHGAYWALYCNDRANAGVTVHVVDRGIDTGGIVYQETIEIDRRDNFLTYPVKQYIAGTRLMQRALHDVATGNLRTTARNDLVSAIWQHPTLWQYLAARWTRGVR